MSKKTPIAALTSYLKAKDTMYNSKVCELLAELENWLYYIPQTFPHYTRHTIQHSVEIILQISNLFGIVTESQRNILFKLLPLGYSRLGELAKPINFITEWRKIPDLHPSHYPPIIEITLDMFKLETTKQ